VGGLATSMLSVLGNTAAIMLLMVFMLVDAGPSPAEPAAAAGPFARLAQVAGQTRQYIKITSLTGLIFSVLVTIVMLLVGTDGAVTWGVLGFFLNFVPNLGMLLTVIPPVLLTLLERGWGPAGVVLGAFIVINFMTDSVIKPRFMRTGLNLGLLESVLALMFFSWVLGAAGAVLSIPIYLTVREAYRRYAALEAARPPA
jgi:predicted PurR-regulated permease PerM